MCRSTASIVYNAAMRFRIEATMLAAMGALSVACTTIPPRHRDAGADGSTMDSMNDVSSDDGASSHDVVPDVVLMEDSMSEPDGTSVADGSSSCPVGLTRCGDVCVDTSTDANHCGACGNACPVPANATATCSAGRCGFTCNAGYADCDGNASNGCETPLNTLSNCGGCGNACPTRANAATTCSAGVCGFTCNPGYADCDGNAANGCETNLNTSTMHCGGCGNSCGAGVCVAASCVLCPRGQTACNNTCVDTTSNVNHCGACGYACPSAPSGYTPTCTNAYCLYGSVGDPRMADCNRNPADGYEVNIDGSRNHCGGCGNACSFRQHCCSGRCVSDMQICEIIAEP
jgi:hypothetical protein